MSEKKVRISVNLPPKVARVLLEMSRQKNVDISEIVRKSIATEYYVQEKKKSGKLLLEENGSIKELKFS
ncbi:MAG: hypothetical protein RLZZ210_1832 [Pseudomonadota bacterium]|jgi:metal-responsive CopG/Arc/MetJ family transcriptional regulator